MKTRPIPVLAASLALIGIPATAGATTAPARASAAAEACVANVDTQQLVCADNDASALRIMNAKTATSDIIIARIFDGYNQTGPSFYFVKSGPCTPAYDSEAQWGNLGQLGWNNRTSSLLTYNHCDVKLYQYYGFGRPGTGWIDRSDDLSNIRWNDQASSIKFS